jgi:hypothetical protein
MLMSAPNKPSLFPLEAFFPSTESNSIRGYQVDADECAHFLFLILRMEINEVITLLKSNFFLYIL